MAKTFHRKEHISQRRAREEEQKKQAKVPLTKKQKTIIWSSVAAAAVVILLIAAFYAPNGSVITWFGKPMFVADDAVIAKANDRYYDVARWQAPEGFTLDQEYDVKHDPYVTEGYYTNDDKEAVLQNFYMSTVSEKTVADMQASFKSFSPEVSDLLHYDGEVMDFDYFYNTTVNEKDKSQVELMIACYIPAKKDNMVLVQLTSGFDTKDNLPQVEDLLKTSQDVMKGITLK